MNVEIEQFNHDLLDFLGASPTAFHAVNTMKNRLESAGFTGLKESEAWSLTAGGKYFVTRNDSAIIAFVLGRDSLIEDGLRMVGAHTDSPCLKVKPHPEMNRQGYFQLGVEVYGGVLLNPWFDRDLSLAGRVSYKTASGSIENALLNFKRALAVIPSLAIHLDREANSQRTVNAQKHIPPILMQADKATAPDFRSLLLAQLKTEHPGVDASEVLDFEMSFYDVQAPAQIGFKGDFIASARLDNLLSCFVEMEALIASVAGETAPALTRLLVCNDHEEVGSASSCGAQGPMLKSLLQRLVLNAEDLTRTIDRSMMISVDNAHGIHPNFSDKHDGNHGPELNKGPVIKVNANQRYASNSETSAIFRNLCGQLDVPVQTFVTRTDLGCGSTIGPITATEIGVKTLDVGVPTFAMHSIRELAGDQDAYHLYRVLQQFFAVQSVSAD